MLQIEALIEQASVENAQALPKDVKSDHVLESSLDARVSRPHTVTLEQAQYLQTL